MFKPVRIIVMIMILYIHRNTIFPHGLIFLVLGSNNQYQSSTSNFIFSFRNNDNLSPFKSNVYQNRDKAIYTHTSYGPTFGGGHDIYIPYNSKTSSSQARYFGHTYLPPSGYSYSSSNTRRLLAGSQTFRPSEIEVYYFP